MKTIQCGLLVSRQNGEVSVDGMDVKIVHAAAYQRINHSIPMYNHTGNINYSEMLNYSNNLSLFNNYKISWQTDITLMMNKARGR